MSKQTKEFESWLATGAKYGTAWEAWQHQAARIAELEAQVKALQRVPLSDGEINNIIAGLEHSPWLNPHGFASAIEAAHNIK